MAKLSYCPFCGGTELWLESFSGWGADAVICGECLATFSQQEITCEEDLIAAWNRRPKGDATRERKRGHWVERNPQNSDRCRLIECDQCGHGAIVGFNIPFDEYTACDWRHYCGCCGADMWGDTND